MAKLVNPRLRMLSTMYKFNLALVESLLWEYLSKVEGNHSNFCWDWGQEYKGEIIPVRAQELLGIARYDLLYEKGQCSELGALVEGQDSRVKRMICKTSFQASGFNFIGCHLVSLWITKQKLKL